MVVAPVLVTVEAPSTAKFCAEPSIVAAVAPWGAWITTTMRPSAATVPRNKDDIATTIALRPSCKIEEKVLAYTYFYRIVAFIKQDKPRNSVTTVLRPGRY